ncbi:MAG: UbiA family prenyltransferase [Candidatus Bathyarchaeota archaeon]|nr:MAG: UbiA family prenyltransferase [Candidatus Bathyarchaeota archaeon]
MMEKRGLRILDSIKDHIFIGGPNAISGWGLLILLVLSGGFYAGRLRPGIDLPLFIAVLIAAALTGNGVYALNAYFDREADAINKPNRPIPSGRMTPKHAKRYAWTLMIVGLAVSGVTSIVYGNYLMITLWSIFTLLGIAYTHPPINLKGRHIWGNLCFGAFTVLTFFIGIILGTTRIPVSYLVPMILYIFYIGGLITMKDFQDVEGDRKHGDITLPVKVGRRKAALLSIGLMAVPTIVLSVMNPPSSIISWVESNFSFLIIATSFTVYAVLDRVGRDHIVSDAYSRVIYFYVILFAAYGFLKGALIPYNIIPLVLKYDRYIALAAYVIVATVTILRSHKMGHDVLKPSMK